MIVKSLFNRRTLLGVVAIAAAATSCTVARQSQQMPDSTVSDTPDESNDAKWFGEQETVFDKLPLEGHLTRKGKIKVPWSDTYWPSVEGSTADRWQTRDHSYKLYSSTEVQNLSQSEIDLMSPTEKYDLYMGWTTPEKFWPLTSRERKVTAGAKEDWEGKCHAWTPAALTYDEPNEATVTSPVNGKKITFYSSDIKALLILGYDLVLSYPGYKRIGERNGGGLPKGTGSHSAANDVNAGSFHIVLANQIQPEKLGFVIDIDAGTQVWNQPVFGYSSRVISREKVTTPLPTSPDATELVTVETALNWVGELAPDKKAHGIEGTRKETTIYNYRLELNKDGEIIGGEWLETGSRSRPDFVWTSAPITFKSVVKDGRTGEEFDLKLVNTLYQLSVGSHPNETQPPLAGHETIDFANLNCRKLKYAQCFQAAPRCEWILKQSGNRRRGSCYKAAAAP
jgi:Transglutaminase elicitor